MIVEGLARSGSEEARSMAEDIALKWLKTNYAAYKKTGTMHEKYDVEACAAIGGGGEYNPQVSLVAYMRNFIVVIPSVSGKLIGKSFSK